MSSDAGKQKKKEKDLIGQIPNGGWLLISLLVAVGLWKWLSINPRTSRSFPFLPEVLEALKTMVGRGVLWNDFASSMISVVLGFALGFVTSVPVAFLSMVSSGSLHCGAVDSVYPKYPTVSLCTARSYLCGCWTQTPGHCHLAGDFPDYDRDDLSGRAKCG